MRFSWTPFTRGLSAPLIAVGLRRNGHVLDTAPLLMVDTGADGLLLHFRWAKLMGLQDTDLVEEQCTGAGGSMTVYRPKSLAHTEIEIDGKWIPIPSLQFGKHVPISLLGRDVIFANFTLKMTATTFELVPIRTRRRR